MSKRAMAIMGLLMFVGILGGGVAGAFAAVNIAPDSMPNVASVDQSFTYQGSLVEAGSQANGLYDFEFRLYNDANVGAQVGTVIAKDDVLVTEGVFTTVLNFAVPYDGTAYWLEIWVRPGASVGGYQQLLPRQQLTGVPYANYASTVPWSGLTGVPVGFADGTDDGIAYSPGNQLSLDGTTFNVVEGAGSGLTSDTVDGWHSDALRNANNINAGTLSTDRYSAYGDLYAEGRVGPSLYTIRSVCGGGGNSFTTESQCMTTVCSGGPPITYYNCAGGCTVYAPQSCSNTYVGKLLD